MTFIPRSLSVGSCGTLNRKAGSVLTTEARTPNELGSCFRNHSARSALCDSTLLDHWQPDGPCACCSPADRVQSLFEPTRGKPTTRYSPISTAPDGQRARLLLRYACADPQGCAGSSPGPRRC
eukprot:scaffold6847_cov64-Phaeocystis_antarctica.AAC.2